MKELKITVDQLKNYLGTGLMLKTKFKTIDRIGVVNPYFTMDCIDIHNQWLVWTYSPDFCKQFGFIGKGFPINQVQPICYRLSDLDKEIEVNGERFVPINEICNLEIYGYDELRDMFKNNFSYGSVYSLSYEILKKLFEWHFWPFGEGYFEHGLGLDKMKHR